MNRPDWLVASTQGALGGLCGRWLFFVMALLLSVSATVVVFIGLSAPTDRGEVFFYSLGFACLQEALLLSALMLPLPVVRGQAKGASLIPSIAALIASYCGLAVLTMMLFCVVLLPAGVPDRWYYAVTIAELLAMGGLVFALLALTPRSDSVTSPDALPPGAAEILDRLEVVRSLAVKAHLQAAQALSSPGFAARLSECLARDPHLRAKITGCLLLLEGALSPEGGEPDSDGACAQLLRLRQLLRLS